MAVFGHVLLALAEGKSIRRNEWEPATKLFVLSECLVCQRGEADIWRYDLSWDEIAANDWQLSGATPEVS
jgi:hypothetical protein